MQWHQEFTGDKVSCALFFVKKSIYRYKNISIYLHNMVINNVYIYICIDI